MKNVSFAKRLMFLLLSFALVPLLIVGVLCYRGVGLIEHEKLDAFEIQAVNLADKIDRNVLECYNEVQAFAANHTYSDRTLWTQRGSDSLLVRALNADVRRSGSCYFVLLAGLDGKALAVNTKDAAGKSVDTARLLERNWAQEAWFKACVKKDFSGSNPFAAESNSTATGAVVSDLQVDKDLAGISNEETPLSLGFSAPVMDDADEVVAVLHCRVHFSLIERIVEEAYLSSKKIGLESTEITVLDSAGRIIIDCDPLQNGSLRIRRDPKVILNFNLAEKGVLSAQKAVAGQQGAVFSHHARKGIVQAAGYAHNIGARGFPGMNWSVLFRADKAETMAAVYATARNTAIAIAFIVITVVALGLWMGGRFAAPLARICQSMRAASEHVQVASDQVSSGSQTIATGATQQASSLEETSASLEELSSMTRQNADNASAANNMAKEVVSSVQQGQNAMQNMNVAIDKVQTSAEQTAKILRSIDEIAFQTNLLALNAAVEAARAGEAGKGFAVVAEEVRALAHRSSEAAKSTAGLIETSRKSAGNSVTACSQMRELLEHIAGSVGKLQQLNGEVSNACSEQSKGIEQINTAISEIDKVTQTNAAAAEESAGASQELSGQSHALNTMVLDLSRFVAGSSAPAAGEPPARPAVANASAVKAAAPRKMEMEHKLSAHAKKSPVKTSPVESAIPLDDDVLAGF